MVPEVGKGVHCAGWTLLWPDRCCDGAGIATGMPQPQRLLFELAQNFIALPSRRHQEAVCDLVRAVADPEHVPAAGFGFGVADQVAAAA